MRALADGVPYVDAYVGDPQLATIDATRFEGHVYAAKAPGLAALQPAGLRRARRGRRRHRGDPERIVWALHLWALVLPRPCCCCSSAGSGDRFEPGLGIAAAVALGAATLVLPFATLYFSHVLAATLGFAAFAVLLRERDGPPRTGAARRRGGARRASASASSIRSGSQGIALLAYAPRAATGCAVHSPSARGGVAGALPALVFNQWAFGSPFRFPYEGWTAGKGAKPCPGIFGLTLPDVAHDAGAPVRTGRAGVARRRRRGSCLPSTAAGDRAEGAALLAACRSHTSSTTRPSFEPFGGGLARAPAPGSGAAVPRGRCSPPRSGGSPAPRSGSRSATGAFLAAATIGRRSRRGDSQVVHRLRTGGYVPSVLDFAGIGGGAADLPFLLALCVRGLGVGVRRRPAVPPPRGRACLRALPGRLGG